MKKSLYIVFILVCLIGIYFIGMKAYQKYLVSSGNYSLGCDTVSLFTSNGVFHKTYDGKYSFYRPTYGSLFTIEKGQFKNFSSNFVDKHVYIDYSSSCDEISNVSVQVPEEHDFFIFRASIFDDWEIKKNGNKFILSAPIASDYRGNPSEKFSYKGKSKDPDTIVIEKIAFEFKVSESGSEEAIAAYFEGNFPPLFHFAPRTMYSHGPSSKGDVGLNATDFQRVEVQNGNKMYFYFLDNNIYQFTFIPGKWVSTRDSMDVFELFMGSLKLKKIP